MFTFVLGKINLFLAVNYMLEINIKLAAWNGLLPVSRVGTSLGGLGQGPWKFTDTRVPHV